MAWKLNSDKPIYIQIMDIIKERICSGEYPVNSRLPSVRELANEAAVNPNTMQKALASLEEEGLLYSQRTSGRFVTDREDKINQTKDFQTDTEIEQFMNKMESLGYNDEEVVDKIKHFIKERRT